MQNGIFDSLLDTSSPQPDDKQDGVWSVAILLLICSHKVWVNVTYFWSTALCLAYACVYANPVLQHKHKHKKNDLVCFSCAYANAYVTTVFACIAFVIKKCAKSRKQSLFTFKFIPTSVRDISDGSHHITELLIGRNIRKRWNFAEFSETDLLKVSGLTSPKNNR